MIIPVAFSIVLTLYTGGLLWLNGQIVALARAQEREVVRAMIRMEHKQDALRRQFDEMLRRLNCDPAEH